VFVPGLGIFWGMPTSATKAGSAESLIIIIALFGVELRTYPEKISAYVSQ
jgi:hypothetical protein